MREQREKELRILTSPLYEPYPVGRYEWDNPVVKFKSLPYCKTTGNPMSWENREDPILKLESEAEVISRAIGHLDSDLGVVMPYPRVTLPPTYSYNPPLVPYPPSGFSFLLAYQNIVCSEIT